MLFRGSIVKRSALATLALGMIAGQVRADNTEEWSVTKVMEKLQSTDTDWKDHVFKGLYISNGKLIYDNDTPAQADDYEVGKIFVKTIISSTGKTLYDLDHVTPSPVIRIELRDVGTLADGGILKFDPTTGQLYYKPANDTSFYLVDGSLLDKYPGLRDQLASLGFTFENGSDGSIIIIDGSGRLGRGPGSRIILGGGNGGGRYPRGGDSVIIDGEGRYPGARYRYPGADGSGVIIQDGNGRGTPGYRNFRLVSGNGGQLEIFVSDADIVDQSKFDGEAKAEWEIGGVKYRLQEIEIPGWFNNEKVILRQGPGGEWYLINRDEHAFIMDIIRNDPKYKSALEALEDYRADKWDTGDYENVRKYAMKYPNARAPQGYVRVINRGVYPHQGQGGDRIRIQDGGGYNDGYSDNALDLFVQDYLRRNPNASLQSLQDAIDKEFGSGVYVLSNDGGRYRVRLGNGDSYIIGDRGGNDGRSGDSIRVYDGGNYGPSNRGGSRFDYSGSFGGSPDLARAQAELDQAILKLAGGGASNGSLSVSLSTKGVPAAATTALKAKIEKFGSGDSAFFKVMVPYRTANGTLLTDYVLLNPGDYKVNADGSITLSAAFLEKLKSDYAGKGVDFSDLATASGAVSSVTITDLPSKGTDCAPGSLCASTNVVAGGTPNVTLDEAKRIAEQAARLGQTLEAFGTAMRVKNPDGSIASEFVVQFKQPIGAKTPINLKDLLNKAAEQE